VSIQPAPGRRRSRIAFAFLAAAAGFLACRPAEPEAEAPVAALSLAPGALFTFLTSRYGPTVDIGFQYTAHFMPYIFPAAVLAIATYGETTIGLVRRRAAVVALVAGTFFTTFYWGAIPPRDSIHGGFFDLPMTRPTEVDRKKHRDLQELNAIPPREAKVAVSEQEMPHISRLNTYSLRDTAEVDYLLYGTASGFYGSDRANQQVGSGAFEIIAERPGLALARRKGVLDAPPPAAAPVPAAVPAPAP
jgi:uncharacterized membrane protein